MQTMEKDMIFFGNNGITSTSANHNANLAKEAYQQLEKELANIRFYNKEMSLLGSGTKELISEGMTDISDVEDKLKKVAQLKSLIAWLREAIKAKDRLLKEANNLTCDDFNLEVPEQPVRETYLTADDIIATWNIKQRNRYYYLETLCAQFGEYIHPNGTFSVARQDLLNYIHNPRAVAGNGRDSIVYIFTPSIKASDVEDTFMHLQNTYRSYQAELNSMKYEVETALQNDKSKKDLKYNEEIVDYRAKANAVASQLTVLKNKAIAEVQNLKIIIPDSLKSVFDEIQALGKK